MNAALLQELLSLVSGILVAFTLGLIGGGGSILAVPLLHHRYTGVAASRTAQRRVKAAFFGYRCRYRFNHCWQGDGSNNGMLTEAMERMTIPSPPRKIPQRHRPESRSPFNSIRRYKD
ncbi:MAG: hypothetical protein COA41_12025 [Sphingopyxis sp.]|nr:MAG: hypothetical protein COA41_12025 [Sphingopyxis sp.]